MEVSLKRKAIIEDLVFNTYALCLYTNNSQLQGYTFKQKMTIWKAPRKFILVGLGQEKSISSP